MSKTKLQQLFPTTRLESGTRVFSIPETRLLSALTLAALLVLGAACGDDPGAPASSGFNDVPDVTLSGRILTDRQQIEIEVAVPNRHHAYLDSGIHENLIPIAFEWQGEPAPELATAPSGEQDDEVKARVLRGTGRFVFAAGADQIAALQGANPAVRVRSQICDEDKGICYRPTWNALKL